MLSFLYWVLSSRLAGSSQYLYNFCGNKEGSNFFLSWVLTLKLHPNFQDFNYFILIIHSFYFYLVEKMCLTKKINK